ncbi:HAD-IIIA family hydrolase [Sulfitobacter sp. JBTF-M27]|uniref:D,D-heptose 1,7-bisphosphate phosphatase n=1 Tax=Sulfitobacter sediminilitoris TaxID=2698830 RepID=A0A6P0CHP4_9RHOB|nr:HAD-IIIA family hydrolase [Sulfitobacter sediminilitoris]NEK24910.1 HAD-IIIA family hydrolase [Sulfitobacter sediminilitoris]
MSSPVAFFDRDGTLIEDQQYAFDATRIRWQPGAFEALRSLVSQGWRSIVVTNQSAVARGFCKEEDVHAFHSAMSHNASSVGAVISAFEFCPFHKDAKVAEYRASNHPDRKPNPGMILRNLPSDPNARAMSFLVGDKSSDIAAAEAAGIDGYLYNPGDDLAALVEFAVAEARIKCKK